MKKTVFFIIVLFGVIFSALFLNPTPSFAACDLSLNRLYVCYNSRNKTKILDDWGHYCYNGNWRIRGAIFNTGSISNTGFYDIIGFSPRFTGAIGAIRLVGPNQFTLASGARLDTNHTVTAILCNRGVVYRIWNSEGSCDHQYSSLVEKIPPCF